MHITDCEKQQWREHRDAHVLGSLFHGCNWMPGAAFAVGLSWAFQISEQARGSSTCACGKLALSDCHTASSRTFHELPPRRESDREVQHAADFVSPSFSAARATRPHGLGS